MQALKPYLLHRLYRFKDRRLLSLTSAVCNEDLKSEVQLKSSEIQAGKNKKHFRILDLPIDTSSAEFENNSNRFKVIQEKYVKTLNNIQKGGDEKSIERHTVRNRKLLVKDRIKLLFDDDSEILEIAPFAGYAMPYGTVPRAGILAAIGKVNGHYCLVLANDATVKGGTVFPITVKKQLRSQEISEQNRIPCIYLVDSGGAFLPLQSEIFPDKEQGGRVFYNEAVLSADGIPQVAVVCGSCTAGAAYIPTMADEAVIVDKIGTIFLGGPPLVKAATGEIVTPDELGGATLHSSVSGCTDHFAATEEEAFTTTRDIIASLNLPQYEPNTSYDEPLFSPEELDGLIPEKNMHEIDMYKIIARLVDGSRFQEFKKKYGSSLVTGFGYLQGHLVGLIGNNGRLTDSAAAKGAHFVGACCERNVPIIFLQNTHPTDATNADLNPEMSGNYLRDYSKMLASVACANVPKLTVILGGSYGSMNYLMCGRSQGPRFVFTWPNAEMSLLDVDLMVQLAMKEKFPSDQDSEEAVQYKTKLFERFLQETGAIYSSSRIHDDGIILPKDTRKTANFITKSPNADILLLMPRVRRLLYPPHKEEGGPDDNLKSVKMNAEDDDTDDWYHTIMDGTFSNTGRVSKGFFSEFKLTVGGV